MAKQGDWKDRLKSDPTEWLLAEDNPTVRYWTLRHLTDASDREIEAARRKAQSTEIAEEVFRQQKPEGHWENPGNMHAPHDTATIYQLTLLGDLGLSGDDERIARGVGAVLRTQREDGAFPGHNPAECAYGAYDIGLIIRFMHQFGMATDCRVSRMWEWLERNQTADGGWLGAQGHCHPAAQGCFYATANVLWGLAAARRFADTKLAENGLRFLAKVESSGPRRSRPLSYPQFWTFWIDDVKLSEIYLGLGMQSGAEPLKRSLNSILRRQQRDGRWAERRGPYSGSSQQSGRLRRLFSRKGEPSKWVTAKAMIVLQQALGDRQIPMENHVR